MRVLYEPVAVRYIAAIAARKVMSDPSPQDGETVIGRTPPEKTDTTRTESKYPPP